MIIRKEHGDHIHIYSDKSLKIKQVETGKIYSEAIEKKDCYYRNTYIEVEK